MQTNNYRLGIAMSEYMHKEFPKTVGRTEFWKQIKRTVNGKDVSEKDISNIVKQINDYMLFNDEDHLLDLGCGNGALASNFFPSIRLYTGVDFSEYLLDVAQEFFSPEGVTYINDTAENFIKNCDAQESYSKVLIYGVMSYLDRGGFIGVLSDINKKFASLNSIFVGNIPNKLKAKSFYAAGGVMDFDLDDKASAIGIWWDPADLTKLCKDLGFKVELLNMPDSFYGSKYRFDMVLTK
jgi:2-polyprenyl-3-methyl-5-hydroxy-6-metoxy-1,4-benzoquinol methylase